MTSPLSPESVAQMVADREAGTPGPWHFDGPVWNQIVWTDGENRLCFMAHSNGLNDDRDIANARRIARLPNLEAAYLTLAAENATLRASEAAAVERVKTITDMATDYLRIATEIGSCGDGGCVVLQQKGQHTNGGCHCLDCLDRSELRRLNGLLGIAQAMAKALTHTTDKEPKT